MKKSVVYNNQTLIFNICCRIAKRRLTLDCDGALKNGITK